MDRTPGKEIPMHYYDDSDMVDCELVDFLENGRDEQFERSDVDERKDCGYNQYEEPFKNFNLYGLFDRKQECDGHADQCQINECKGDYEGFDDDYDENEHDWFDVNKVRNGLEQEDNAYNGSSSVTEYVMDLFRNRLFV